ncbi:MAG: YjgF-like protein [Aureobasidium pullulans]|nr:MAG: YjgF-like protein [Aureobasidium pullulans]
MPPAYTTQQKAAIQAFVEATSTDRVQAAKWLRNHNWNTSAAANQYFAAGGGQASTVSKSTLNKLFDKYREDVANEPDEVNIEGTMALLNDIEVSPEDVGALIFSELVKSPSARTLLGLVSSMSLSSTSRPTSVEARMLAMLWTPLERIGDDVVH